MSTPTFNDFYFFLVPMVLIFNMYLLFFKTNTNKNTTGTCQITASSIKKNNIQPQNNFCLLVCLLNFLYVYTAHGKNGNVWFNHFYFNNFNLWLLYTFIFVGFSIYLIIRCVSKKTNLIKSIDYLLSINNLIVLLPYLFCINTIFSFLFFLELLSVVLFYKLLSSKIWFKNNNAITNNIPQNYINMVFFQYWVTFFSTIFIIYFYIGVFMLFGSSDWFIIQYINTFGLWNQLNINATCLLLYIFIIGLFLKLGIAPLHLFKVEVYNGLPFITILFYTTFYFIVFFLFFFIFVLDFLFVFLSQLYSFLVCCLFFGCIYVIVMLFDVNFIKAFFAYSTVINSIGFIVVFLSTI